MATVIMSNLSPHDLSTVCLQPPPTPLPLLLTAPHLVEVIFSPSLARSQTALHPILLPCELHSQPRRRRQLKLLHSGKAVGPDGVSTRMLKACDPQLCGVLHWIFTMSLSLQWITVLWKTSCLVPVPKTLRLSSSKDST